MKKLLKYLLFSLGGLLGVVLLGVMTVYVFIGYQFSRTFDVPNSRITIPADDARIAEGKRLASLRGCNNGCHGDGASGQIFFEIPDGTRLVASDLAAASVDYSTADLIRIIRHGVRPNGTSVVGVMPSEMFYNLTDADLGAIVAFLRTQTPSDEPLPDSRFGPLARLFLAYIQWSEGGLLAAESIDHDAPRLVWSDDDPLGHGEYLAKTICTECHSSDLRGSTAAGAPNLSLMVAYSADDFRKLMQTGVPIGDRELDLMREVAINRFTKFTDRELDDLYVYLQTLASDEG